MSNYTISVNWSGKDALSDSDPAKVISGSDFNTEFTAVQTAVNTKANLNGSATEAFSVTTESSSSNTTVAASTAYVTGAITTATTGHATQLAIIGAIYPIGSLYTSTLATNPGTTLGLGTWVAFGEGQVVVGKASSGTFDTAGATGGSETHTLTTNEMPSHKHASNVRFEAGTAVLVDNSLATTVASGDSLDHLSSNYTSSTDTSSVGGGAAHNNLQPYIVVYMWKRTA